jgi:hypothetical protein
MEGRETEWIADLPEGNWSVQLDPDDWLMDESVRAPLVSAVVSLAAYPNPSGSDFVLSGELAGEGRERGTLAVYDVLGRLVARKDLGLVGPGSFETKWDARSPDGGRAPGGVYFARVDVGAASETQRMVVLP